MLDKLEPMSDLEHVRRRVDMYFNLAAPLVANCMARESYCLAIDQIVASHCTQVITEAGPDKFLSVTHEGDTLGILEEPRFDGLSEMQAVAEQMRFCADRAASEYVHAHVCTNGMTALNACCERFELHNYHNNRHYVLAYDRGIRSNEIQDLGPCLQRGVGMRFKLDDTIVGIRDFDLGELQQWFASLPIDVSKTEVAWLDRRA